SIVARLPAGTSEPAMEKGWRGIACAQPLERVAVTVLQAHVVLGRVAQLFALALGKRPGTLDRTAHIKISRFQLLARRHQRTRGYDYLAPDDGAVHHGRAHADKAQILDGAAMQY